MIFECSSLTAAFFLLLAIIFIWVVTEEKK